MKAKERKKNTKRKKENICIRVMTIRNIRNMKKREKTNNLKKGQNGAKKTINTMTKKKD